MVSSKAPTKALCFPGYRSFWLTSLAVSFSLQILFVSVAWQVYDQTGNAFLLGLVGLCLFLPSLLFILVTGLVADRYGRRRILQICICINLVCALAFGALSLLHSESVWPVFALLALLGTSRAFWSPAAQSLAPNLVPPTALANAITVNSSAWQLSTIAGPAIGGVLYGVSPTLAFATAAGLLLGAAMLALTVPQPLQKPQLGKGKLDTITAGFRYILSNRVVLGAVSLDMFAVLAGGAVALMPIYTKDILQAGPQELGLLRAAPGLGALAMAWWLGRYPIKNHAGVLLFSFVGLFGAFTVVFGLSTNVWLSIAALSLVGASDMVSVTIRETIMQLWTPEEVRGRVNAVKSVFIGASNELGDFRAGAVAFAAGPVFAAVAGGVGAMAIAAVWARLFPELRRQGSLERPYT